VLLLLLAFWLVTLALSPLRKRRSRFFEGTAWTLTLAGLTVLLYSPARAVSEVPDGYVRVRVAAYNTYNRLSDPALAQWLAEQRVDVIALVDPPYSLTRTNILPEYLKAHTLTRPVESLDLRLAIASRWAFEHTPLVDGVHHTNQRSFVAHGTVLITTPEGARFRFAPLHPVSPRTKNSWRASLRETEREAGWIADAGQRDTIPWVVGGDFNATPASRLWRSFSKSAELSSPVTPFTQGTWPAWSPTAFALPIDRVWASPGVRFGRVTVGPRLQSDHRPIVFELFVPISAATESDQTDQ
jgi:endonuclease/exonuclease/phosphatase family metal-dependent hydrolase